MARQSSERGQTIAEYALVLVGILLVCVAVVALLGQQIFALFPSFP